MPAAQSSPTFLPPLHTVQRDAETHSHTPFKNIFELCHCVRDSLLCVLPSLAPACTRPPSCLLFSISPTLTVSFSLSCARHSSVLLDLCLVVLPQCRFLWSALRGAFGSFHLLGPGFVSFHPLVPPNLSRPVSMPWVRRGAAPIHGAWLRLSPPPILLRERETEFITVPSREIQAGTVRHRGMRTRQMGTILTFKVCLRSSQKNRNSLTQAWVLVALTVCFTCPVPYRVSAESRAGEWKL